MSPKDAPKAPPDRVASYDRLVAAVPGIELKGATMPYTSMNGNMFSYLDASGSMAMRLSAPDRTAFIERFSARLHEAHGIVQRENVSVPDAVLDDLETILPWFRSSVSYAASLRPKKTTR